MILAVGIAYLFYATKTKAKRKPEIKKSVLVEVMHAKMMSKKIWVHANGIVKPTRELSIFPLVSGQIIDQSKRLVPGGFFKKGDMIVRIDPQDYLFIREQRKAEVETASFDFKLEQGRGKIAEREWDLLKDDVPEADSNQDLALRKSHLEKTRAVLNAAKSGLEKAELDLKRTVVRAPSNAIVKEEYVDIGRLVSPQVRLATLIGVDQYWVQVSIPVNRLTQIKITETEGEKGSFARIINDLGQGVQVVREGRVEQLMGDLDTVGRLARLLISVEDPLNMSAENGNRNFPLLIGAYVNVEIEGGTVNEAVEIPRSALHDEDNVWIMDKDDLLEIRQVQITWRLRNTVLITNGIKEGERIVLSRVYPPVSGTKLRVQGEKKGKDKSLPENPEK